MSASTDLLEFVESAKKGQKHQYAHSNVHRPMALMALARDLADQGLVHLLQKRDRSGLAYIAVRTSRAFSGASIK